MDADTKFLTGVAVSGGALSALVLYKYPQKYWIPWLFIIMGSAATTGLVGFFYITGG